MAAALEKKGDWPAAIDEYRKASLSSASVDLRGKAIRTDDLDPATEYAKAQLRLKQHIAWLKSAGKSSEAAQLETTIHNAEANSGLSAQLDAAMQAGAQANQKRNFDEAKHHYQQAVDLAQQMQPHDQRLVSALDHLGNEYYGQDASAAQGFYERELKAAEEIYGPVSGNLAPPLESLGRNSLFEHDYASAEKFFLHAVDSNEKVYGEGSDKVAASLVAAASVYVAQKQYAKAEPDLLRALRNDQSLYGDDSPGLLVPLASLCDLYDRWGQPGKQEPYERQLLAVIEKQFGATSPQLVAGLNQEAKAFRRMGRAKEAAEVETRVAAIRSAATSPN